MSIIGAPGQCGPEQSLNTKFILCSNFVQTMLNLCSNIVQIQMLFILFDKNSIIVQILFILFDKNSYLIHNLFKSNAPYCASFIICSNIVRIDFCLEETPVKNSNFVLGSFNAQIFLKLCSTQNNFGGMGSKWHFLEYDHKGFFGFHRKLKNCIFTATARCGCKDSGRPKQFFSRNQTIR